MSDKTSTGGFGFFLIFIVLKLAGPCVAWSWWWVLLPAVPPLVELVKVLMR